MGQVDILELQMVLVGSLDTVFAGVDSLTRVQDSQKH